MFTPTKQNCSLEPAVLPEEGVRHHRVVLVVFTDEERERSWELFACCGRYPVCEPNVISEPLLEETSLGADDGSRAKELDVPLHDRLGLKRKSLFPGDTHNVGIVVVQNDVPCLRLHLTYLPLFTHTSFTIAARAKQTYRQNTYKKGTW